MQTREKILMAFRELAMERGFYDATVDELAMRSNMSKRTIYRYFKSKEEIIQAVVEQFLKEMEQHVSTAINSADNPVQKVSNFIRVLPERLRQTNPRIFSDLQKYYPAMWEMVEEFRAERVKILVSIIVEGSKEGYFKAINPTIVTAAMLATIRTVGNPAFVLENNLTMETVFKTVMQTFLYGIVNQGESAKDAPLIPIQ